MSKNSLNPKINCYYFLLYLVNFSIFPSWGQDCSSTSIYSTCIKDKYNNYKKIKKNKEKKDHKKYSNLNKKSLEKSAQQCLSEQSWNVIIKTLFDIFNSFNTLHGEFSQRKKEESTSQKQVQKKLLEFRSFLSCNNLREVFPHVFDDIPENGKESVLILRDIHHEKELSLNEKPPHLLNLHKCDIKNYCAIKNQAEKNLDPINEK